jgi:ribosomal subunit interface protein
VDVRIAGHQVDTGESLRGHASRRMADITEKYFSRSIGANVTFGRGPNNDYTCDIVAPVVQGVVLKAAHRAQTAQIAFDAAAAKIETQLRRYTNRLKDHKVDEAQPYVEDAGYTIFSGAEEMGNDDAVFPAIVAETRVDIPQSSVSDAVMLMDLRNTSALMFTNSGTGQLNMIYRRDDGNIGWVEPNAR